jgi:small subunit ribosomal protein S1
MPDEPTPSDGSSPVDSQQTELPANETPAPAPERVIADVAPAIVEPTRVETTDATPTDATPDDGPPPEPTLVTGDSPAAAAPAAGAPTGDAPKKKRRRRRKKKKPHDAAAAGTPGAEGAVTPEGESSEDEGDEETDGAAEAKEGEAASEGADASEAKAGEPAKDKKKKNKDKKPGKPKGPPREKPPFGIGEEVAGKITKVMDEALMIDVAGKALGIFDRSEAPPSEVFTEGERFIGKINNDGARGGLVVLTRDLNRWQTTRTEVEEAFKNKTPVAGLITGVIKGGVEVDVKGLRGFAPASHVELRLGADLHHLIGQRLPFDVVQFAKRGREFVLSRKSVLEEEAKKNRAEALQKLEIGAVVKGIVRSVTQFGAFVDVGGIDGLVHVTEASHTGQRLSEIFKVGQETEVKILKVDEKGKVWLSKRATERDPWAEAKEKYARGTIHKGKIVRLQPFGAFIELEPGVDGLMHVSDIASPKPFKHPNEVLEVGKEIDVIVATNDAGHHKIALHPAPKEGEAPREAHKPPPRINVHQAVKVAVEAQEINGLVVRILGQTGRNAKGYIPATATNTPKGTDLRKKFPVGMELEAKIVEMGPRGTKLSIKALAQDQERQSFKQYQSQVKQAAKFGTFGDLLMKKGITK